MRDDHRSAAAENPLCTKPCSWPTIGNPARTKLASPHCDGTEGSPSHSTPCPAGQNTAT
jgi:hypothetical protein